VPTRLTEGNTAGVAIRRRGSGSQDTAKLVVQRGVLDLRVLAGGVAPASNPPR